MKYLVIVMVCFLLLGCRADEFAEKKKKKQKVENTESKRGNRNNTSIEMLVYNGTTYVVAVNYKGGMLLLDKIPAKGKETHGKQ